MIDYITVVTHSIDFESQLIRSFSNFFKFTSPPGDEDWLMHIDLNKTKKKCVQPHLKRVAVMTGLHRSRPPKFHSHATRVYCACFVVGQSSTSISMAHYAQFLSCYESSLLFFHRGGTKWKMVKFKRYLSDVWRFSLGSCQLTDKKKCIRVNIDGFEGWWGEISISFFCAFFREDWRIL